MCGVASVGPKGPFACTQTSVSMCPLLLRVDQCLAGYIIHNTCALTEHLPQPRIDDKCCAVRLVRRSARLLLPDLGWEAPKIKVVVDPVQEILPRPRR